MKELKLWKFIFNKIVDNKKVTLLIVANASKASPGRTGFKMAIAQDGTSIGTIGGGIMEFNISKEVEKSFSNNENFDFVRKLYHNNLASGNKSGLICGGVQTMVFKSLSQNSIEIVTNIIASLEKTESGLLLISKNSFNFIPQKINSTDISLSNSVNENWIFEANIGTPNTVYIVGGGHVGLAISRVMSALDFYVVIFDHRNNVQTMDNNVFADKKIITSYAKINDHIIEGNKSYVAIVTPSHDGDKNALQSVLNMEVKYIGSMGSAKKIKSIFNQLKKEGFSKTDLDKIHTPIGLEIEAESPEEIAISIAAEIIKIKNG